MSNTVLRFANVTGFMNRYIRDHDSTGGVRNVRLCTIGTSFSTIEKDSPDSERFVETLELAMSDAPTDGVHWNICAWLYDKCSVVPVISHGDTGYENIPLTIYEHLIAMADGEFVVGFEVTFDDLNPTHKWLFIAE